MTGFAVDDSHQLLTCFGLCVSFLARKGSAIGIRDFCMALRKWKPDIFNQTDFKLTDGCSKEIQFKALSLRKVDELVKYGLDGEKAPSISAHGGHHVDALEFHKLMEKESTVIIDVRNHYETCIGRFVPPDGGADYIDPMMRTSSDFPKWLNSESTKEKLNGKNVLMYCTGGIRCERATALLNQFQEASQGDLKTKSVKMVRCNSHSSRAGFRRCHEIFSHDYVITLLTIQY